MSETIIDKIDIDIDKDKNKKNKTENAEVQEVKSKPINDVNDEDDIDADIDDADYFDYEEEVIKAFLEEISEWINNVKFSDFSKEIKSRVIGQEKVDLILADVYNYLENISLGKKINNNALMAAPSGCGKTETYRALRDYFKVHIPDLPIAQIDISIITEEGITGGGTELLTMPLMDSELGGYGIIFMDEFDKKIIPLFAEGSNMNAGVQSQLLTIIEGRCVEEIIEGKATGYSIDTSRTMFIGLGSFNESRETKKKESNSRLGFCNDNQNKHTDYFEEITREDMIKMGASYEMIGRFPLIINYHALSYDAVDKIIDKITDEISDALNFKIKLTDDMRQHLHKEANGVYGCRMIDSLIRSISMEKYVDILMNNKRKKNYTVTISSPKDAVIS